MIAVTEWLKQFRSAENQHNGKAVNEYTEPKKLRISKTIGEENRVSFNDTFLHHKKELDKLKFNR